MKKDDDKLFIILDKLSSISERTARMEAHNDQMRKDLEVIKDEDKRQNQLLDKHIAGTVANTDRLNLEIKARQDLEKRVMKVEKIPGFMGSLYKVLTYIALPVGIVYEGGRILHLW